MTSTRPAAPLSPTMLDALPNLDAARPNTIAALRRRGLVEVDALALTDAGRALVAPLPAVGDRVTIESDHSTAAHLSGVVGVVVAVDGTAAGVQYRDGGPVQYAPYREIAPVVEDVTTYVCQGCGATVAVNDQPRHVTDECPDTCQHLDGDVVDGASAWVDAPTVEVQAGYCKCGALLTRYVFPHLDDRALWEPRVSAWSRVDAAPVGDVEGPAVDADALDAYRDAVHVLDRAAGSAVLAVEIARSRAGNVASAFYRDDTTEALAQLAAFRERDAVAVAALDMLGDALTTARAAGVNVERIAAERDAYRYRLTSAHRDVRPLAALLDNPVWIAGATDCHAAAYVTARQAVFAASEATVAAAITAARDVVTCALACGVHLDTAALDDAARGITPDTSPILATDAEDARGAAAIGRAIDAAAYWRTIATV